MSVALAFVTAYGVPLTRNPLAVTSLIAAITSEMTGLATLETGKLMDFWALGSLSSGCVESVEFPQLVF